MQVQGEIVSCKAFNIGKMENEKGKEEGSKNIRNKGGRPKKSIVRTQHLAVKCSMSERWIIEANARNVCLPVSVFLRELGLRLQLKARRKVLPKDVLALTGTLNHTAANLNQIAKKRNGLDELNPMERAELKWLSKEIKTLTCTIKAHFHDR